MATLTLDRERRLTYTWGAIKRLKAEQGINFLELVSGGVEWWMDPTLFSAVLWCGLITEDPALTVADVDALITVPRLPAIVEAMMGAVVESTQEGEQSVNPPTLSPS